MMTVFVFTVVFCLLRKSAAGFTIIGGEFDDHAVLQDNKLSDMPKSTEEIGRPDYSHHSLSTDHNFEDLEENEGDPDGDSLRIMLGSNKRNGFENTLEETIYSEANVNDSFLEFTQDARPTTNATDGTPTLQECMKDCPFTNVSNPICGTDNITYASHGKLVCAQYCGVDIYLQRNSPCLIDLQRDVDKNSPQPPRVNTPISLYVSRNLTSTSPDVQSCINNCLKGGDTSPVCGSDGRIYDSPEHLLCTQFCGSDVKIRPLSTCLNNSNVGSSLGKFFDTVNVLQTGFNTQNSIQSNLLSNFGSSSTNSVAINSRSLFSNIGTTRNNVNPGNNFGFSFDVNVKTTTMSPYVRSCLRTCPTTTEHNPVCGSNRVVYNNPGHLTCAIICGVDVVKKPLTFCSTETIKPLPPAKVPKPAPTTKETVTPATTLNPLECSKSCSLPPELKFICGINGVTYININYLQCMKKCGADVDLKSYPSCRDATTSTRSPPVAVFTPKPVPENTTKPELSINKVNITIPQAILDDVFNNNFSSTDVDLKSSPTGRDVKTSTRSPPVTTPEPVPETSTQASTTFDGNKVNFKIPEDILNVVFVNN